MIAFTVGLYVIAAQAPVPVAWLSEILSSAPARRALAANPPRAKTTKRGPVPTLDAPHSPLRGADVYPDPQFYRDAADLNDGLSIVGWLELKGDYRGALRALASLADSFPESEISCADSRAALDYLTGHQSDAYTLMVRTLAAAPSAASQRELLLVSLLSARLGLVYPGQLAFARGVVLGSLRADSPRDIPFLPRWDPDSPRDVAEASAMALEGSGIVRPPWAFLEQALVLNPSDVAAADQLVRLYELSKRYSEARRVASKMVKQTTDATAASWFMSALSRTDGLSDGPLPPKPAARRLIGP